MSARQPLELPSHEVLSQLARDDPAAYEALRREMIDGFIDSAPPAIKPRLRGIQFRVDSVRRLSRSALGATVKIYGLMWESFLRLNHGWQDFIHMKNQSASMRRSMLTPQYLPNGGARVIEFRRPPPRGRR